MTPISPVQEQLLKIEATNEQLISQIQTLRQQLSAPLPASRYCYFISAGHGGIDPDGNYTTAPNKMFRHNGLALHDGPYFYEGVFNRIIAEKLIDRLRLSNITYEKVYHEYKDINRADRIDAVNDYHQNVGPCIYIDLHSNASRNHDARGFSVYTSVGQTQSDQIATTLFHQVGQAFQDVKGFKMRSQEYKDKDVDYEKNFDSLHKTLCPAILPEFLFFDQRDDVQLLMMDKVQEKYADCLFNTILWCESAL